MINAIVRVAVSLVIFALLPGCSSQQTFTTAARAGDTLSLPIGWYPDLKREDLTITVTPQVGAQETYLPGDPAVRAVVNMHPDPLARMLVQRETQGTATAAAFDAWLAETAVTAGDKELSEKFIVLDLPASLAEGLCDIDITSSGGEVINPLTVDILPGTGSANTFDNWNGWNLNTSHLRYFERPLYYTVDFSGSETPYAIQIDLTHDAGGFPYVVAPRGDILHASWSDDGMTLRVILMPTASATPADIKHFKFYVPGGLNGLTNLTLGRVGAYDISGGNVQSPVSANITAN